MTDERSNNGMLTELMINGGGDIEVGSRDNIEHDVDIDNWAGSLSRILEDVPQYMCRPGHPGRISRIPDNLREVDAKAYEPCFISIGPYHHGKPMVQSMEKRKQMVLKYILQVKPEITLNDYLNAIESIEPEARSFYSNIEMDTEKFVHMLLVDSMYILTVFCGVPTNQESTNQTSSSTWNIAHAEDADENNHNLVELDDSNDDTKKRENNTARLFSASFHHDLFLLENQLPLFVLQRLHSLAYGESETQLISIIKDKVSIMLLAYAKLDLERVISPTKEVHHLLDMCHMFFHPSIQQESIANQLPESRQMFRLGSAMQLHQSGVNFIARSGSDQHSLLDITFGSSGKMIMPSLVFDGNTNSLLRNLIALEQMKYPSMGLNVSAYAVLLLHLVTTPEDAQLLRRKEILRHHLPSDKKMMYLVNRLSVGLSFDYVEDTYSLKPVFQELNRYCQRRVPRWKVWLKHRYFNNPWTLISLLAATILLVLTVVQTYYAVYSYYHPYFDGHS